MCIPIISSVYFLQKSDDDSIEDEEDVVCLVCNQRDPPTKSRGNTEWICCDFCDKWLHSYCNKIPFVDGDLFHCGVYKEKLSVGITCK